MAVIVVDVISSKRSEVIQQKLTVNFSVLFRRQQETRAKGLMCSGQRVDSEILQIIQLEGCVILIDQNSILAHDGMPLYAYQICDFDKIVMFH